MMVRGVRINVHKLWALGLIMILQFGREIFNVNVCGELENRIESRNKNK